MEIKKEIIVEQSGSRLDVYLTEQDFGDIDFAPSRSYLQKLIADQCIILNGKAAKAGTKLKKGDHITVSLPEPKLPAIEAEDIALSVVYEDSDMLVINKPQGMVVHPAEGNYSGTLVNALLAYCHDLSGINGCLRPGIVHRLDKMTSGLIMVAKNDLAHSVLADQIKDRKVVKKYLALVQGLVREKEGVIIAPIARSSQDRKKMTVAANGREAITEYRLLEHLAGQYSLLSVNLKTGRTHQIRVHLRYLGFPVVDDPVYGPSKNRFGLPGQFLHAAHLEFDQPRTGEHIVLDAPLPENMQQVLRQLGSKYLIEEESK